MSTTTKANIGSNVLQTYLNKTVLENFEPNLQFYKMGKKATVPGWYNVLSWARASKLTLTSGQVALTEWVTPTSTGFTYSVITASPTQYGMYIEVSDRLLNVDPLNVLWDAAKEIGANMAKVIDAVIQTELATGTNVLYAGWATQRTGVSSTMVCTASDIRKSQVKLKSLDAPELWMGYVGIAHPFVIGDLQGETATGWFIDSSKYARPEQIFKWEIGMLYWVRIVSSSNIQTFASTTTVYPTFVMWEGAYWVADFASLETIYTPKWADKSDPLAQRATVGAKVDFVPKLLQNNALVRIESAAVSV